jgi:hypothetical protein
MDEADAGPADAGEQATASLTCRYQNPFSRQLECREYLGTGWDEARVTAECKKPFTGVVGELSREPCQSPTALGSCTVDSNSPDLVVYWFLGGDPSVLEGACATFLNGQWQAGAELPDVTPPTLEPAVIGALASDALVTVTPDNCIDDACRDALLAAGDGIVFAPAQGTPEFGLVLMPGASVDARSYAQSARHLAEHGVLVALMVAKNNFAPSSLPVADKMRSAHPDVTQWFVAGHSLGGNAALAYTKTASGLSGVILWGSYPDASDGFSSLSLPVLSISGALDGTATPEEVAANKANLPASTRFVQLPGANHAQFGNYGTPQPDGKATLGREQQQWLASDISEHFMRGVLHGAKPEHAGFAAVATKLPGACEAAQRGVLSLGGTPAIHEEVIIDSMDFAVSKASIANGTIEVKTRPAYAGNPAQLDAPAMLVDELWCKVKTSEALAAAGLEAGTQGSCGDLNALAFAAALAQLSTDERTRWDALNIDVHFADDLATANGPEWLGAQGLKLERAANAWTFTSAKLQVSLDAEASPEFLGVQYCKLLTAERALLELLSALEE